MDYLLPPLTTIPTGIWKCPLFTPPHLLPLTTTRHLRLPSPILDLDSDSTLPGFKQILLLLLRLLLNKHS